MNLTDSSTILMENAELEQGEFYDIIGRDEIDEDDRCWPVMYIRDEKISDAEWNVFAGVSHLGNLPILMRIRAPKGSLKSKLTDKAIKLKKEVIAESGLVTKLIINPRSKRSKLVNSFISEAYRLSRTDGPNATTLEQDAYEMAGIRYANTDQARLRIIIDHYQREFEEINFEA